ncbi:uncharacterized protein K02A2.6-like [Lingula anatina]|uniref:Uncharacterized protein K02A2.6-like n=1 Tax=Lingula anatina TaxID=7574 RepID=A0A1S3JB44_LINAN|nr:uncharacterized protein K02A2.6-like [Lingula anatina]|eukprot:XP_013407625.2 uncharacterized protein K02A2.6-like [Lingula anatina]
MEIENMVRDCIKCSEYQNRLPAEPLKPTVPPDLPYTEVGCDIFDFGAKKYLLLIDYYSKYIDVVELNAATTTATINAMRYVFSCHGIPLKIRSDNGPQFSSCEFKQFCKVYDIEHMTSSPQYPGSNGEAERAIQIVKKMWKKCDDKYLALLNYRTTPLEGINLSPSQLLMGRRPRNTLPAARNLLKPQAYNQREVKRHFSQEKLKQKHYYDQRKGAKELKAFNPGEHKEAKQREKSLKYQQSSRHCYLFFFFTHEDRKLCLDATETYSRAGRMVNDSPKPNAVVCKITLTKKRPAAPHLVLFALKEINIGNEIVYDYGDSNNLYWRKKVSIFLLRIV